MNNLLRSLAFFLMVGGSYAQSNLPAIQDFQSTSVSLKSSGFSLNVDQLIELKFNPITETIAVDLKKIQFELETKREKLSGKVCKLEIGISTWNADGRWINDFSYQSILLEKKIEVEPRRLYQIVVPQQNISFPKNSLDQSNNKYRVTFKIYIDRPEKIGSPCEAHVPVHTPFLNKYLLDQVALISHISQQATQSDIQKTNQPKPVNLSLQSWKTYENFDVETNDVKLSPFQTIASCDAMCKEDSSCIAYTFNKQNRNCWLKNSIQRIFQINPDIAISAVKSAVVKSNFQPENASLQIFQNFDIDSNDEVRGIANSNEESCKATCIREDSCAALTFNKINNMCWLKNSVSNIFSIDKNIAVSAVKFKDQKNTEKSGWVSCSRENNFCTFDGVGVVRFGVDGKFNYKDVAFEVGCTTAQFGDPALNVRKNCEYKLSTLDKKQYEVALKKYREENNIEGWRFCAIEGEVCKVNENSEIRYGISNTYNTKLVTANVTCDNNTFGDPTPGFLKKCFVKDRFLIATPTIGLPQKSINAHALVIGNSAYAGSSKLTNPVNDARSIAAKLRELGFKVTEVTDADRNKLVSALALFSRTASDADLSLLFYAGHGVQITGTNYMLPVDLNLNDLTQAPLQGISLNDVVEKYLPGKTKLVFLDACRDNPLMQVASRGVSRGLAPINVSEGTLISYATKDGSVAQDGDGRNSPFTTALLEHIGDPDDIAVVLRKVREKVMKSTGNKQQPWEYGSLTGGALVLSAIKPKLP
jgi:hypothetical protein